MLVIFAQLKKWFSISIALCAMATLSIAVGAQDVDATAELAKLLGSTISLQGGFDQQQYDKQGSLLSQSSGHFGLLRPGYFFWRIESPDSQSIIATPEYLWHHDLDLETVTRRPITDSSAMSPLQILGGDLSVLESRFSVVKLSEGVFTLIPVDPNSAFERLTLTLDGNHLSRLEIIDTLAQRISIRFNDLTEVPVLLAESFSFTPPAGADLFYYDD